uniref:Transmembrane protein n=1 Tax=Chromera velia CCMP2878 TaxID=1169474 RepID=A0A0G4GIJ9_9ALVE|eukprot:Cvel_4755.t1-p1 / transcript=Cvel_4755.t1 / gene=Cvel_4755 / organism=Chromera_velia_CCMP2878 / gene_product=hypothetical protein / transcript_product=hypothetical protein / location=Cvel_scaffold212:26264-28690(-) / protein_length=584 / sequence_SO=supercontig / SO=protein_coding / is_pseudo=false
MLMQKSSRAVTRESSHLRAYVFFWCLHQAVPFFNVLFFPHEPGAIDNRPIGRSDWVVRLPLIVLSTVPSRLQRLLLACAHFVNLVFFAAHFPFVWDHMCWAALMDLSFVLFSLTGDLNGFFSCCRLQHALFYCASAFWKVNSNFLDARTSCGTLLGAEFLSILPESIVGPPGGSFVKGLLHTVPVQTVVGEYLIGQLLLSFPLGGVVLGLAFHLMVLMLPVNAAGGFSVMCASRMIFFLLDPVAAFLDLGFQGDGADGSSGSLRFFGLLSVVVALVGGLFGGLGGTGDASFMVFLLFSVILILSPFVGREGKRGGEQQSEANQSTRRRRLRVLFDCILLSAALLFAFGGPLLGLQSMGALTMYSNLSHYGGSNHLIVPTNLLFDRTERLWRVDFSGSASMRTRSPADASGLEPEGVRRLLETAVGRGTGRFFAQYYARMATMHSLTELDFGSSSASGDSIPFVLPEAELTRLVAEARQKEDFPFRMRLTRLADDEGASEGRGREGEVNVEVEVQEGVTEILSCTVAHDGHVHPRGDREGIENTCRELVDTLDATQRSWRSRLWLPYPIPLIPETSKMRGIPCLA